MRTVDATDGEIRFNAHWGGSERYCFLANETIAADAGRPLSRNEAIEYVREHLERYRAEAREQHGDDSPEKIVIMTRRPS